MPALLLSTPEYTKKKQHLQGWEEHRVQQGGLEHTQAGSDVARHAEVRVLEGKKSDSSIFRGKKTLLKNTTDIKKYKESKSLKNYIQSLRVRFLKAKICS